MATDPVISVIMPVHNAGHYLQESVESVLRQSFADFELIIIDDCSTDGAADHLADHPDPRIRFFRNQHNLGAAGTRNLAIERSRGDFIAIQDADDISRPDRFRSTLALLEADPTACVAFGCHTYIGPDGRLLAGYRGDRSSVAGWGAVPTTHDAIALAMRFNLPFGHGAVVYRRDCFVQHTHYERAHEPAEDYYAFAQMLIAGCRFVGTDQIVYDYRVHPQGISKTGAARLKAANIVISAQVRAVPLAQSSATWTDVLRREPSGPRAEPRLHLGKHLLRSARFEGGVPLRQATRAVVTGMGPRALMYLAVDSTSSSVRRAGRLLRRRVAGTST